MMQSFHMNYAKWCLFQHFVQYTKQDRIVVGNLETCACHIHAGASSNRSKYRKCEDHQNKNNKRESMMCIYRLQEYNLHRCMSQDPVGYYFGCKEKYFFSSDSSIDAWWFSDCKSQYYVYSKCVNIKQQGKTNIDFLHCKISRELDDFFLLLRSRQKDGYFSTSSDFARIEIYQKHEKK